MTAEMIPEVREVRPDDSRGISDVSSLLESVGLRPYAGTDRLFGIYDALSDRLLGCGGLSGNLLKGLALTPALQGSGAASTLVTALLNAAFDAGHSFVRVFTKPEYSGLFRSLGFVLIGRAPGAVLLESDSSELRRYKKYLELHKADGVIVANANPLTLGHLYLIREAAARCGRLAVIPLMGNGAQMFGYEARRSMLLSATASLPNVEVLEGSGYTISEATFPTYFIKEDSEVARQQARLDLDIFCTHIAPALGATVRFAGTEPADPLTDSYNDAMRAILPARGIGFREIPRLESDGCPVSASRVRKALAAGSLAEAMALTPRETVPAMLGVLAVRALRAELDLEPKPGLVDPSDCGSHTDMDYPLMLRAIKALAPYFTGLAEDAFSSREMTADCLRSHGLRGERMMMEATGGVNTHKGAIFAVGLAVASAARILAGHSSRSLPDEIADMAARLGRPEGTHGYEVCRSSRGPGALDYARSGYHELFSTWLPMLQSNGYSRKSLLRLLLTIISELHDTNAIHRAGLQRAEEARLEARRLAGSFTDDDLKRLNEDFRKARLSHGGAADMLSLTIFIESIAGALAGFAGQKSTTSDYNLKTSINHD